MAKKIADVNYDEKLIFSQDGRRITHKDITKKVIDGVANAMLVREQEYGMICYLTPEEFDRARGWEKGSCVVQYKESMPVKREGAYYLEVLVSNPGDRRRIAFHTHEIPEPEKIVRALMQYLDLHEYEGDINMIPPSANTGTYVKFKEILSKDYKKGQILESK